MLRFFGVLLIVSLLSCDNDRGARNPYLQEIVFRFDMNLNLPLYSPLTNLGNAVFIDTPGVGIKGIFVIKSNFDQYRAFEASCPNHVPNECSTMELDGQIVTCPCDGYEYYLFTGQQKDTPDDGNRYYNLLEYQATISGNVVIVTN